MRVDPPGCRCTDCIVGYSRPADPSEWDTDLDTLLTDMEAVNGPVSEAEILVVLLMWPDGRVGRNE